LVLAAPAVLILPWVGAYFYPAASRFSDLTISHAPNALFLLRSLLTDHTWPLWSGAIMSGYPFAGDPLAGLWYPPGWLALLLPQPAGFNLAYLAHTLWGGIGLTLWLRGKGLRLPAAAAGGLAFELLPKAAAHFAAGHISLVYALAWTPWLLWAEDRRRRGWRWQLGPGVVLGVILLADLRWAAYAGALWLAYSALGQPLGGGDEAGSAAPGSAGAARGTAAAAAGSAGPPGWKAAGRALLQRLSRLGLAAVFTAALAAALAAPLLVPLLEFTRLSTRANLTAADANTLALPAARFLGLIFPDAAGNAEWVVYAGGVVFVLAAASAFVPEVRRRGGFWLGGGAAACLLAPGLPAGLGEAAAWVPGVNLLRVPARAMLLGGLAAAVLAAYLADALTRPTSEAAAGGSAKALNLFLAGITALTVLMAGGVGLLSGGLPLPFAWGTAALLAGVGWIQAVKRTTRAGQVVVPAGAAAAALLALIALDSGGIDLQLAAKRLPAEVRQEGAQAAQFLAGQPGIFRVYSPSYSLPQLTAAAAGLELADGIDPLQVRAYADFFAKASGVRAVGYSVTLPAFATGDPAQDNRGAAADTRLLGLLNVRYVAAAYDLADPALRLVRQFGETRIYENLNARPRAWVQAQVDSAQAGAGADASGAQSAQIARRGPNRVTVTAQGPGVLVLAEVAYPGWQVWVDGERRDLLVVDGLLRGVALDGGTHAAEFVYRPASAAVGLAAGGLAWAGVGLAGLTGLRGRKRRGEGRR
jgi:hypothetical protein